MKSKNFKKKLTLNKKTIADLSNRQLEKVYGEADVKLSVLPCAYTVTTTCPTQAGGTCGSFIGSKDYCCAIC